MILTILLTLTTMPSTSFSQDGQHDHDHASPVAECETEDGETLPEGMWVTRDSLSRLLARHEADQERIKEYEDASEESSGDVKGYALAGSIGALAGGSAVLTVFLLLDKDTDD